MPSTFPYTHSSLPKILLYRRVHLDMREAFSGYWKQTSGVLVIALVLRLLFVFCCPRIDDGDPLIYKAFAHNLLAFGIYSHYQAQDDAAPEPTLIRVPGYPLMLAAVLPIGGGAERNRCSHYPGGPGYGHLSADCIDCLRNFRRRNRRRRIAHGHCFCRRCVLS